MYESGMNQERKESLDVNTELKLVSSVFFWGKTEGWIDTQVEHVNSTYSRRNVLGLYLEDCKGLSILENTNQCREMFHNMFSAGTRGGGEHLNELQARTSKLVLYETAHILSFHGSIWDITKDSCYYSWVSEKYRAERAAVSYCRCYLPS